jgi:hypothetical protein
VAFAALVVHHDGVKGRLDRARRAVAHHERNLDRLADRWIGAGPTGADFLREDHVHARDLDVFGEGSLFQFLCTARTRLGERALAGWLTAPADAAEIRVRQQAVAELTPDVGLRERLALLGAHADERLEPEEPLAWAAHGPVPARAWERIAAVALAGLAVAATAAWLFLGAGLLPLALVFLVELAFGRIVGARLARMTRGVERAGRQLATLAELVALIEGRVARAGRLAALASALDAGGEPASRRLARLQRLEQAWTNSRLNAVYGLVAVLLQLRVHWAYGIEAWRRRHGPSIAGWLDVAGEFEALCSLSAYAWERPDHVVPEIVEGEARFEARQLGHPLIPAARCVRNDLTLGREPQVILLTGSNMSGKSTLLRAVGVNVLLATAGAPVCARGLVLSPFAVGASIRVLDSLREGASRFYAEVSRLRAIHRLTDGPQPVLFLLDEILQGTNSHERRLGSEAVVRSLVERGAVGLVTTHDLALTEIVSSLGPRARNAHFADELVDGTLHFDYRMRDGVVRRGNALEPMRSLGLDV